MDRVPALPATLSGIALFLLPGLLLTALVRKRDRDALAFDEALYLAVGASVAAASWVALLLAELGRFSLTLAGALLGAATLLLAVLLRRRLAPPLPRPRAAASVLPAALLLALSFALDARPTEYLLGGRDPGTYVATMAVIGRTGGIVVEDPLVTGLPAEDRELFFRHADTNPDFSWGRFMGFPLERPQTGRVYPEFFHLFPAFGGYLFQAMGAKGALATPPVFAILATLGVFLTLRRLFGPAVALLGTLLLATNVVQVWFARYPVSEPMSQFLLFLGLLAVALWEERGLPHCAALAGAAFGLTLLVRIDSLLLALPLAVYLVVRRAHHHLPWRRALPLLLPLGLLAVHAGLHGVLFARKYVLNIAERPYWRQPAAVWVAGAALALAAVAAAHHYGPRLVEILESRREAFAAGVSALVVLLALYAYFVRPLLSAWAGGDGNPRGSALEDPALLHALGFRRLAAHDAQALLRLGWFVTPVGLVLALLGLLLLLRDWRPRALLLVLTASSYAAFYLYKIRVWNDYFFALRRYVPVVLPALLALAAFALVRLAARGGARRAVAALLALGLLAGYAWRTRGLAGFTDWKNAVAFVADVARRFGPEDMVIFEQRASIHLLSLPLWAVHGVNVLELARFNPDPVRLAHLLETWRGRYRNLYVVRTYRTDVCGLFLQRVEDYAFGTFEWERTLDRPPVRPEPRFLRFTLERVVPPGELDVPPLRELDVGGTDDFQVSGFHGKEGGGDLSYRWTGACGSLYLPGARAGDRLVLRAGVGLRPPEDVARVRVSLNGAPVGEFRALAEFTDHAFTLPAPLPPGPPILRLDVDAFRPSNVWPDNPDTRDLGVMVDRVRLEGR